MSKAELYFDELLEQVCRLEDKFINQYFPTDPTLTPSDYGFDVHAYCLLCHAAMEEFAERVALRMMSSAIEDWILRRAATDTLLLLISYFGYSITVKDDPATVPWTVYDHIRTACYDIRSRFSKHVNDNHGVSVAYLAKLLIPVGIDIPSDANQLNSLAQLTKARGDYAHNHKGVKSTLAPEDARRYVIDCLFLFDAVRAKAVRKGI